MQDTKHADAAMRKTGPVKSTALTVNGEPQQTTAVTLLDLLAGLGYGSGRVATAVNGEFVPERLRGDRALSEGDAVEIVAPRQGG